MEESGPVVGSECRNRAGPPWLAPVGAAGDIWFGLKRFAARRSHVQLDLVPIARDQDRGNENREARQHGQRLRRHFGRRPDVVMAERPAISAAACAARPPVQSFNPSMIVPTPIIELQHNLLAAIQRQQALRNG